MNSRQLAVASKPAPTLLESLDLSQRPRGQTSRRIAEHKVCSAAHRACSAFGPVAVDALFDQGHLEPVHAGGDGGGGGMNTVVVGAAVVGGAVAGACGARTAAIGGRVVLGVVARVGDGTADGAGAVGAGAAGVVGARIAGFVAGGASNWPERGAVVVGCAGVDGAGDRVGTGCPSGGPITLVVVLVTGGKNATGFPASVGGAAATTVDPEAADGPASAPMIEKNADELSPAATRRPMAAG